VTYTPTGAPGTFHTAIHHERTGPAGEVIRHVIIEAKPKKKLGTPDKAMGVIEEAFGNGNGPPRFGRISAKVREHEVPDAPKEESDHPSAPREIIAEGGDLSENLARMQLCAHGFNRAGFGYRGDHQNINTFASAALQAGRLPPATGVAHDPTAPPGELLEFFAPGLIEPLAPPVGQHSRYEPPFPSNRQDPFGDRFGKWISTPDSTVPQPSFNRPESFGGCFGNWGYVPAGGFGDAKSPVLRVLDKKRSENGGPADPFLGGLPGRLAAYMAGTMNPTQAPPLDAQGVSGDKSGSGMVGASGISLPASAMGGNSPVPSPGIVSGQPMPQW
jgi:hypothetical protein